MKMASVVKPSITFFTKLRDLSKLSKSLNKLEIQPMKILKGTFTKLANGGENRDEVIRRFFFNRMGHFKYGLYTEDLINEVDFLIVRQALQRLSPEIYDARAFRITRALLLDKKGEILPEDEWITYEEDRDVRYLQPYIIEIEREMQEKRNHGIFC